MGLVFEEYRTRRIVNVHKRVDPWFWDRYSATPYVGCRSGCEFCYLRGQRYLPSIDPDRFDTHIRVKINAVERLRRELPRLEKDTLYCGDWQQPAETRYGLSRQMLEVVLENGFPLVIIERSPLLERDVDLLVDIGRTSWVFVLISISSLDPQVKRAFEPRSPGLRRRLKMMEHLASRGIPVGVALMPVFPYISDDKASLRDVIRVARDHGASVILAGTLSMEGVQAQRTLRVVQRYWPHLETAWRDLYRWHQGKPAYAPPRTHTARLGRMVREICQEEGVKDRLPRYVVPGPRAWNKKLAEHFHLRAYALELAEAPPHRIWAYRKAAWSLDDYPGDVRQLYRDQGVRGLQSIPHIGVKLAREAANWLEESGGVKGIES